MADLLLKIAADWQPSRPLAGRLFHSSKTRWLLLSVPNAIVRGAFDALQAQGAELPYDEDGVLDAHISVAAPEEVDAAGGPEAISERGHMFRYSLEGLGELSDTPQWSRVWAILVSSPELTELRKSYGLPPKVRGDRQFHITYSVRRKHVLRDNTIRKAAECPFLEGIRC